MRRLTNEEIDHLLQGHALRSHTKTDGIDTKWDVVFVAVVTFGLLWPFGKVAVPQGENAPVTIRELWFLVAYAFTFAGVAVGWAKVRDHQRRSDYATKLDRRLRQVGKSGAVPWETIAVADMIHGTREEVAVVGDRLVAIRTRPEDRYAPSWETLLAREVRTEELEREAGLRPEEPQIAELCERLAWAPVHTPHRRLPGPRS